MTAYDLGPIKGWLDGRAIPPASEREMIAELVDVVERMLDCEHEKTNNYGEGLATCADCGVRWWY